jgi:hypothetical protein
MQEQDSISLKWGTLKSWNLHSEKGRELLKKYCDLGSSASAMCQHDTPEQKDLICQMIDECNAETIYLDWDGVYVSKDEAKKYVMDYGRPCAGNTPSFGNA